MSICHVVRYGAGINPQLCKIREEIRLFERRVEFCRLGCELDYFCCVFGPCGISETTCNSPVENDLGPRSKMKIGPNLVGFSILCERHNSTAAHNPSEILSETEFLSPLVETKESKGSITASHDTEMQLGRFCKSWRRDQFSILNREGKES